MPRPTWQAFRKTNGVAAASACPGRRSDPAAIAVDEIRPSSMPSPVVVAVDREMDEVGRRGCRAAGPRTSWIARVDRRRGVVGLTRSDGLALGLEQPLPAGHVVDARDDGEASPRRASSAAAASVGAGRGPSARRSPGPTGTAAPTGRAAGRRRPAPMARTARRRGTGSSAAGRRVEPRPRAGRPRTRSAAGPRWRGRCRAATTYWVGLPSTCVHLVDDPAQVGGWIAADVDRHRRASGRRPTGQRRAAGGAAGHSPGTRPARCGRSGRAAAVRSGCSCRRPAPAAASGRIARRSALRTTATGRTASPMGWPSTEYIARIDAGRIGLSAASGTRCSAARRVRLLDGHRQVDPPALAGPQRKAVGDDLDGHRVGPDALVRPAQRLGDDQRVSLSPRDPTVSSNSCWATTASGHSTRA